ncbi:unnamed protein product [Parnassius apollo]|uniref:(apollo) hypothetical protein n=1 Tax=Parnassius apollo TaxID=110799 RepID=A0A8S3Y9V6_PARAO|nr:unnamed protein product [Parnassius apollo]
MPSDVLLKREKILKVGRLVFLTKNGSMKMKWNKRRPTICPIPTIPDFDDDNANEEENIAQSPEVGQQTTDIPPSTPEVRQQMAGTLLTTPSPTTTENYRQPKRTKRGQKRTEETPSTVLMKYIIDSKKNTPPLDGIEQFTAGMTTTLRSFPPRDRAIAKAKIFEIVSRMEIDILSRPSTSTSMVSTPSSYNSNYAESTPMPDTMQDFSQRYFSLDTEELTYERLE